MSKWTNIAAEEEMDSAGAYPLINIAAEITKEVAGDDAKTLCIGCGDGTELELFKNVEGIDLNENSLRHCAQLGYIVHKMDMHKLDFADDSFDLIFARDSFEHAEAPIQVLSEMARVSKRYVAIIIPDESWECSRWHFLIPTLRQMISMGDKVDLNLRTYREYNRQLGLMVVFQHLYIFEKRNAKS